MITKFLNYLGCVLCNSQLQWDEIHQEEGWLHCANCAISIPVISGFPMFNEPSMGSSLKDFNVIKARILSESEVSSSPFFNAEPMLIKDPYPAFQPFNESGRSLTSVIENAKNYLKAGDVILDVHNYMGWTGAWLASLFPDQLVISIAEGNIGPMGYSGFFNGQNMSVRPKNLLILFSSLKQNFPIKNRAIRFLYAYDSIHFYPQLSFINRCLFACSDDGVLAFPHVHLANNEPEPYFVRGGDLHLGKDYQDWFDKRLKNTNYRVLVKSEKDLFLESNIPGFDWHTDPMTSHYNGVILIANNKFLLDLEKPISQKISHESQLIPNPLLILNPLNNRISICEKNLDGQVGPLLDQHPLYRDYLEINLPLALNAEMIQALVLSEHGLSVSEILAHNISIETINTLINFDILAPISKDSGLFNLQRHFNNCNSIFSNDFLTCWKGWAGEPESSEAIYFRETPMTRIEADLLVRTICAYYKNSKWGEAQNIYFLNPISPDIFCLIAASYLMGLRVCIGGSKSINENDICVHCDNDTILITQSSTQLSISLDEILEIYLYSPLEAIEPLEKLQKVEWIKLMNMPTLVLK